MRVIKYTKLEKERTCSYCECVFVYIPIDVEEGNDCYGSYKYVKCPCCGTEIKVYE